MSDDENDIDDKEPLEPRKRRGAGVPNIGKYTIIEMLPTLAAIAVLKRMSYKEISALCSSSSLFAYRFCGGEIGKSTDLEAVIDAYSFQPTAAMYVMLFKRDWGVSRKPNECLTSVPVMREYVAASMERHFPRANDGLRSQIDDMRKTYLQFYKKRLLREYAGVVYAQERNSERNECSVILTPVLDVIKNSSGRVATIPDGFVLGDCGKFSFDQRFGLKKLITSTITGFDGQTIFLQTSETGKTSYSFGIGENLENDLIVAKRCDLMVPRTDKFADGVSRFNNRASGLLEYGPDNTRNLSRDKLLLRYRGELFGPRISYAIASVTVDYEFACFPFLGRNNYKSEFVLFYREETPQFEGTTDAFLGYMKSQPRRPGSIIITGPTIDYNRQIWSSQSCIRIDEPGQDFDVVICSVIANTEPPQFGDPDDDYRSDNLIVNYTLYTIRVQFDADQNSLVVRDRHKFALANEPNFGGFLGALVIYYASASIRIDYRQKTVETFSRSRGWYAGALDRFGYNPLNRGGITTSLDDYKE